MFNATPNYVTLWAWGEITTSRICPVSPPEYVLTSWVKILKYKVNTFWLTKTTFLFMWEFLTYWVTFLCEFIHNFTVVTSLTLIFFSFNSGIGPWFGVRGNVEYWVIWGFPSHPQNQLLQLRSALVGDGDKAAYRFLPWQKSIGLSFGNLNHRLSILPTVHLLRTQAALLLYLYNDIQLLNH